MNRADDLATQAGLQGSAFEANAASLAGELSDSVQHYRQRLGQRTRGDTAMGHPRVIAAARKRVEDAMTRANDFGNSPDYARISADAARSLKNAAAVALGVLANNT